MHWRSACWTRATCSPPALFHASRQPSTLMRINFSTTQDAAFWCVFERMRDQMPAA
jgi:hypothetical protein